MDRQELDRAIFDFLEGNLRIEYDSYRKEILVMITNPYSGKEVTLSRAWIHDLSNED